MVKPLRFGQLGMSSVHGSTLNFPTIDLPIHPTDWSETLEEGGLPRGQPLDQRTHPETLSIMRNRKSWASTSRTRRTWKTPNRRPSHIFEGARSPNKIDTKFSCVMPTTKIVKKLLQIRPTKIPKNSSKNHRKGKNTGNHKRAQGWTPNLLT
jgi:hypothetical protein